MTAHGTRREFEGGCRCDPCVRAVRRVKGPQIIPAGLPPGEFGKWREQAACKGRSDINWFPDPPKGAEGGAASSDPVYRANVAAAKAVCAFCPVMRECLTNALDTAMAVDFGIRGGRTQGERDRMRRDRKRGAQPNAS